MLAFITSVRHPQNAADYQRVEHLLRRTLRSVCAQTSEDYVVVVVCNQVPAGDFPPQVEFVTVDFPAPSAEQGPRTGREAVLLDKGTKLAVGLLAAQAHRPDYVMKFDADDFVSRRLAELAATGSGPGWYVDEGFVLSDRTGLIAPLHAFNTRCGTSEIVANHLYGLPSSLPATTATQDELYEALGNVLIRDLLGSHRNSVEHFASTGNPLVPTPFPGAVYYVGTGENHSGKNRVDGGKPPTAAQVAEFGLEVGWLAPRVHMVERAARSTVGRLLRAARLR